MPTTKLILNSANRTSGTSQKCKFVLRTPGILATSYQVKKIEVPHSFYNITNLNNKIVWVDDAANSLTTTLTNGNYSISDLLTHIGTVMTASTVGAGGTASYSLTADNNTKKITITNNLLANFSIDFGASNITKQLAYDLGFFPTPTQQDCCRPTPIELTGSNAYTANNVYWIGSPKNILIKSNLASRNYKPACNTLAKNGGQIGILEQLLVNTLSGEITTQEFANPDMIKISPRPIFELDFELLDQELNQLDLNGREWSIHIVFDLFQD